ncbi:hypothetical protein AC578_2871 [Pseudocercospora eumusae]|uniref:Uncharacterized protein n=1 Tax=Pseudocercospora eumusae TaxID=321146 RepID=A0A139H3P0_9PEZI|nr:hypothetical protein AC578_2871 [Pseudocercospora eumusae]
MRAALRIAHYIKLATQPRPGFIKTTTYKLNPHTHSINPQMHQDMKPAKAKKTLKQCLESLPQELWNEIYDLTFSPPHLDPRTHVTGQRLKPWILFTANPPSTVVYISKNYKPPWQLQICRQMREEFSRTYYTSTFVGNASEVLAWASSKRKSQRCLVKSIYCWVGEEAPRHRTARALLARSERSVVLKKQLKDLMASSVVVFDYRDQACS